MCLSLLACTLSRADPFETNAGAAPKGYEQPGSKITLPSGLALTAEQYEADIKRVAQADAVKKAFEELGVRRPGATATEFLDTKVPPTGLQKQTTIVDSSAKDSIDKLRAGR